MALRIVFMGTSDFSLPFLQALQDSTHSVTAVFTQPERLAKRGMKAQKTPVAQLAQSLNIPIFSPPHFKDEASFQALKVLDADFYVVVSYGLILPARVLALPRYVPLNIHASLLPRWRGAAPIQRCIEAGDDRSGVCVMKMEASLDTGPVYAQAYEEVQSQDTAPTLLQRLCDKGVPLLMNTLSRFEDGSIQPPTSQAQEGVCYASKIAKEELAILWEEDADALERRGRAFVPQHLFFSYKTARGTLERVQVISMHVTSSPTSQMQGVPGEILSAQDRFVVRCGQGALVFDQVRRQGRRPVTGADFLRGERVLYPGVVLPKTDIL